MDKNIEKKVIELQFLDELEIGGVNAIALVEEPAIEKNFMYFKKDYKFVKPSSNEPEEEFIARCVPFLMEEGHSQDQALAICYKTYEEEKLESHYRSALGKAREAGFRKEDFLDNGMEINEIPEDFHLELAKGYTVYKYSGALGSDTRDFCREMLSLDRFYTYEEIADMGSQVVNPGLGKGGSDTYSIWKYKGGVNCKHEWKKFYVTAEGTFKNKGPAPGIAGEKPFDMPNHARVTQSKYMFKDEDKRELVGPVAIPDMEIYRNDEINGEYYIKFSKETVRRMAEKFMKDQRLFETNIEHQEKVDAGSYVFESWIVEHLEDKANSIYNLGVPIGTWVVKSRVTNEETWRKVKNGDLRGFSLEGNFLSLKEYEDYMKNRKLFEDLKTLVGSF